MPFRRKAMRFPGLRILAKHIAQKIVSGSELRVNEVLIIKPAINSFEMKFSGSITRAGPFDAEISFETGLIIAWSGGVLGRIKMPNIAIAGRYGGEFEVETTFEIKHVGHLTEFTKVLLSHESFDWVITGDLSDETLNVFSVGITITGISLPPKTVTLKGFNNLKDRVIVNSFDLPGDHPDGGVRLTLDTTVTNPSQVGIDLSGIGFQTYFNDTNIGPVTSNGPFTLLPLDTSSLRLSGRLVRQTEQAGLSDVSAIFSNFIRGLDSHIFVHGDFAGPKKVTWLNDAIKSLVVEVILPNRGKLSVIKSIELGQFESHFTEKTAYDPVTSNRDVRAVFTLPFDFPVDIKALKQNIDVSTGGAPFAELVIPKGPTTTDVQQRITRPTVLNVPFAVFGDQHSAFQRFLTSMTTSTTQSMTLSGNANAEAGTDIGLLSLTGIEFSVNTSIAGLQCLTSKPSLVTYFDVNHGFQDYLLIKVNLSLFNPSNITLGVGDVEFDLVFRNQHVGTAVVANFLLRPGNVSCPTDVHFQPRHDAASAGQVLLENYLQGVTSDLTIQGSQRSTAIDSLKPALSTIRLTPVEIPALHRNLISSARLELPTDVVQTRKASASFTLDNPFTASINVFNILSTVTYQEFMIGKIDYLDLSSSPLHADGHSSITSPRLPFVLEMEPSTIVHLVLLGAQNNNVDLGPLVDLFKIVVQNPNYNTRITTGVSLQWPSYVSGKQFDMAGAILDSLTNLMVTLDIETQVKVDEYSTKLTFKQFNVAAITNETALYLIGAVAPPIVQTLVDNANLSFSTANITNLSDGGFDLELHGFLTNIGPLDTLIEFVDPVTVTWQGNDIATIIIPPICAAANVGVPDYHTNAHLTIIDEHQFIGFATFLLHNASFTWTIHTNNLRVIALGTIFDGVSLSKDITLKAFNGLPSITISDFQLPSDDPAGGIHIEADSVITSPSQVGIDLGTVVFHASFEGTDIGRTSSLCPVHQWYLAPESETKAHLSGRITPKSSTELIAIGRLFSEFLVGHNQNLIIQGDLVQPSGNVAVGWLSSAFKTLELQVILPGQIYEIVESITIYDLEVMMTEQDEAFAPLASSRRIVARYKNPFGFSLQVFQASEDIILGAGGEDAIDLKLPLSNTVSGVSTGNTAELEITFSKRPLKSLNDRVFSAFLASITDTQGIQLELRGSADIVAKTAIGNVPISNIPFNVTSSLIGINSFGNNAWLHNVSITGSGRNGVKRYIIASLTALLHNPSDITLLIKDISLAVFYRDVKIGRAVINTLNLVPGENMVSSEFHYEPDDANDPIAQTFLSNFIQTGDTLPLSIKGDSSSTPYPSLVPAIEGISLFTGLTGLNVPPIITHINVYIPLSAVIDNLVFVDFDIANPLDTDMHIRLVEVDSGIHGQIYAHFKQYFASFSIPAKGTANSGRFGNVRLTMGAILSSVIIPWGRLDVFSKATVTIGNDGYTIPSLDIKQHDVTTTYDLAGYNVSRAVGDFQQACKNLTWTPAALTKPQFSADYVERRDKWV
ncbi:hypothetical protein F5148DRAFT_1001220 [Russula earlei]|uniref:Uncharacterized protein n=1 Tax=Russula earlei TaxID=71964 RepID=A0ACC0U3U0_9AGAM|nr:hypothetical protein F5148DRAFT_1001220 [Russula earlei]